MTARQRDHSSLADRYGLVQVTRACLAVIVAATAVVAPSRVGDRHDTVLAIAVSYALVTSVVELVRRHLRVRGFLVVNALLLVDGLFIAAVHLLGGDRTGFGFLAEVHVIAVTLLVSYRVGLKVALWHVLLLFGVESLRAAGAFGTTPAAVGNDAVVVAVAVLLVAVATAGFSSMRERELRRARDQLGALAEMTRRMEATRDPDHIVDALVAAGLGPLGFRRVEVVVADDGPDVVVANAWASREPQLVRRLDPSGDRRLHALLPGADNVVVVPLVAANGQPVGAAAFEWGGSRIPGRTVEAAAQFGAHTALALHNAQLQAEVRRLATTDALTGLANRRVFEESLHRALAGSARTGEPCAVLILDLDHFKSVNDRHGHLVGDDVLRHAARVLAHAAREADLAARYGGEEFVVLLPGAGASEAVAAAERLRLALAETPGPVPLTASAGVAVYPSNATDDTGLLAAADAALYESKRNGRNRVTASDRRVRPLRPTRASA